MFERCVIKSIKFILKREKQLYNYGENLTFFIRPYRCL